MTSLKNKLYTVVVEDSHKSSAELLLAAANEAAIDYSSIYNWKNISVETSSLTPKNIEEKIYHFFDIYGDGEAQSFNPNDYINSVSQISNQTGVAAREAEL